MADAAESNVISRAASAPPAIHTNIPAAHARIVGDLVTGRTFAVGIATRYTGDLSHEQYVPVGIANG